jgi:hypothetical protein
VAGLLNADADEIAVTTSASAGINSLASALDFSDLRNYVRVSNLEFPTGAQIWHAQTSRWCGHRACPEGRQRDRVAGLPFSRRAAILRADAVVVLEISRQRGAIDAVSDDGGFACVVRLPIRRQRDFSSFPHTPFPLLSLTHPLSHRWRGCARPEQPGHGKHIA